jgi:sec-independent protein translocase protein TatA
MNFSNIGFTEILVLLLIFVLFFGARRIPEIGASIGKGIKEFKNSLREPTESERVNPPSATTGASIPADDREPKRLSH